MSTKSKIINKQATTKKNEKIIKNKCFPDITSLRLTVILLGASLQLSGSTVKWIYSKHKAGSKNPILILR